MSDKVLPYLIFKKGELKFFLIILLFFIPDFSYAGNSLACSLIKQNKNSAFLELHSTEQNIFILNIMYPQFSLHNFCIFIKGLPENRHENLQNYIRLIQFKKSYEKTASKNKILHPDFKSFSIKGEQALLFFGDKLKYFFKLFGMEQYYFDSNLYKNMEEMEKQNNKRIFLEISFRI